jgi:hypothetical protein
LRLTLSDEPGFWEDYGYRENATYPSPPARAAGCHIGPMTIRAAQLRDHVAPEPRPVGTTASPHRSIDRKPGTSTVTSALHGVVCDDPRTRAEFLSVTGGRLR